MYNSLYKKIPFASPHVTDNGEAVPGGWLLSRSTSYIPYGEVFVEESSAGWQSPYYFNSKELDEETGLYYYGARYLNPTEAMWLSVDPMWENDQDKTPYHVCKNNPVKLIDYDGRKVINEDDVDYINEFDYYSNVQNEFIEKYGQNAYGLKSKDFSRVEDYAEYKRYKKDFHNSSKRLSYFRKASENTQKEINDFKEKCPDLYETMNNLTYFNDIGEEKELDIHISSNNKGRNVNVYHFGGAYTQPRILYKNSIFTSAEAFIFLGTHIGKGGHLAHEMGHVMSFAILPLLYYEVAKQIGGVHNCQEEANLPLLKRSFISMWAIEYQNIFLGR